MDLQDFFQRELAEHQATMTALTASAQEPFVALVDICVGAVRDGGKLMFFGNGGSAGDAQHLATELAVRYVHNRRAIPAIALTTDSSAITAIGNDFGFDELFARQIEAVGKAGDVAIAISTSGQSENVIRGLQQARSMNVAPTGWSGKDGGRMVGLADPLIIVPSQTTARIQEAHIFLGQILCNAIEIELGLVPS